MRWQYSSHLHRSPHYNDRLHRGRCECGWNWRCKRWCHGNSDNACAKLHIKRITSNDRHRWNINPDLDLHSGCNFVCLDRWHMCHQYDCNLHRYSYSLHFIHRCGSQCHWNWCSKWGGNGDGFCYSGMFPGGYADRG